MVELEDLHINGLKIYQDASGFRFGTDSVLLARFACLKRAERVCDLCSGSGIVGLLVSAFCSARDICCVEIDSAQASLAEKSVVYNKLSDRMRVLCADIRDVKSLFAHGEFDLVTVNPPYHKLGSGKTSARFAGARSEQTCSIADVTAAAAHLLHTGGRLCVVHRADRVADVLCSARAAGLEPKRLRFVCSKPDREPYVLLCEAVKGARPGMRVDSPFFIMDERGEYTAQFRAAFGSELYGG